MSYDPERAARLKSARIAAGFTSAAEVARRLNMKGVTVRAHESDQNGFKAKEAERYAKLYNVSVEWLLFGRGENVGRAEVFDITDIAARAARSEAGIAHIKSTMRRLLADLEGMGL